MARRPQKREKARPVGRRERWRARARAVQDRAAARHARRDHLRRMHATLSKLQFDIEDRAPKQHQPERGKFYTWLLNAHPVTKTEGHLAAETRIQVLVAILAALAERERCKRLAQRQAERRRRAAHEPVVLPRLAPCDEWTPPATEDAVEPVAPPAPPAPPVDPALFRQQADAILRASAGKPVYHRPVDRWRHMTASNLFARLRPLYRSDRATFPAISRVFGIYFGECRSVEAVKKLVGRALRS